MGLVRDVRESFSNAGAPPCLVKTTVAEKFYCRSKRARASGIGGSYKSMMEESLGKCNLVIGTRNINVAKLFKEAGTRAECSGAGASQSFLNFENLQDIVNQLGQIGSNKQEDYLGPMSSLLFDVITADMQDSFLDGDLYIPKGYSALQKLTEIIAPRGIMSDSDKTSNYVQGIDNYTNETLIAGDMTYGDFKLHLPTKKCIGLNKIRRQSTTTGSNLCLYMAIGPADEVICGSVADAHIHESSVTTLTERVLQNGTEEVKDQPYTLLFYLANANTTEQGVLEELASRCLRYTKVAHLGPFYRELAVIKLGFVRGERAVIETRDDTTTIRTMRLSIGEWNRLTFKYGLEAGVSLKRKYDVMEDVYTREREESDDEEDEDEEGDEQEVVPVGEQVQEDNDEAVRNPIPSFPEPEIIAEDIEIDRNTPFSDVGETENFSLLPGFVRKDGRRTRYRHRLTPRNPDTEEELV